jgi:hypothetical protein
MGPLHYDHLLVYLGNEYRTANPGAPTEEIEKFIKFSLALMEKRPAHNFGWTEQGMHVVLGGPDPATVLLSRPQQQMRGVGGAIPITGADQTMNVLPDYGAQRITGKDQ